MKEYGPNTCPRRMLDWGPWTHEEGLDGFRDDGHCKFCGSLNPDTLMARLEAGDVELGPTDKNYKVYVRNSGGAVFSQAYRTGDDERDVPVEERTDWVTREREETKFYFVHLTQPQMVRFIELHNERKLKLGYPHHFYRWPFFMGPVTETGST